MQSFTKIIAASVLIASVSGSPLQRREVCGSAPSGSGSATPLSEPSGITTAEACQAQCEANTSCLSFVFGMVNSADQCMLFAVAASALPAQSSSDLVAYDKACTSVPNVVPTTSNPTGSSTGSTSSGTPTGGNTGGSTGGNTGSNSGGSTGAGPKLAIRDTCGATPSGASGNASPIQIPANIASASACKAQCQADSSCKSFEFGTLTAGGQDSCRLFSVAAASVPAPTSGQSLVVYDVGCSM